MAGKEKNFDIEKIAKAIEDDAGQKVPGIRESLRQVKSGQYAAQYSSDQLLVVGARKATGLSQTEFSKAINTPVATLRGWEQGRFDPPGAVVRLMQIALKNPKVLLDLAA